MRKLLLMAAMLLMTGCAGWTTVDTTPHPVGYYWVEPMTRAFGDYYYYYGMYGATCYSNYYSYNPYCSRYRLYSFRPDAPRPHRAGPERARPRPPEARPEQRQQHQVQPRQQERARVRPPANEAMREYRMRVEVKEPARARPEPPKTDTP